MSSRAPKCALPSQGSRSRLPRRRPLASATACHRLDDTAERGPRRLFHRPPRAQVAAGEASPVAYGGFATRGVALTVDAALAAMIFLTGTAVVGLVGSLVWHPHWATSLVAVLLAVAGLLVNVLYFAGFWSTAGQTPGMRLMHLRVVDPSGSPPGLGRSLCVSPGSPSRSCSSSRASCRPSSTTGDAPSRTSSPAPWSSTPRVDRYPGLDVDANAGVVTILPR